jgi:2-polyprenyl-6-hydroxyphenyl methylase/3-demethylubiquinone-9 3-methyltransferase
MNETRTTFSFGQNWKDYLDHALDAERVELAGARTRALLRRQDLKGLSFLDVGCGSGLFSYVAHSLGASHVTSFDVHPLSVECCRHMRATAGDPVTWEVLQGSILDEAFIKTLPRADIVYSWGVLHHTGSMWQAIRNAASLVRPGGHLAIAIYNKLEYRTFRNWRGSHQWLKIKRCYNHSGRFGKSLLEWAWAGKDVVGMLGRLRNPLGEIRAYKQKRGMSWWYDVVDWLGGYPYEFASAGEIFQFCHDELGMQLEQLHTVSSLGCHEFLFRLPVREAPPAH